MSRIILKLPRARAADTPQVSEAAANAPVGGGEGGLPGGQNGSGDVMDDAPPPPPPPPPAAGEEAGERTRDGGPGVEVSDSEQEDEEEESVAVPAGGQVQVGQDAEAAGAARPQEENEEEGKQDQDQEQEQENREESALEEKSDEIISREEARKRKGPGSNVILVILDGRKGKRAKTLLPPVHKSAPEGDKDAKPNYTAWAAGAEKVLESKKEEPKLETAHEAEISAKVLDSLWKTAVAQHKAQLARAQRRLDLERKIKEVRAKEIQALREQALQEEEKRKQREEQAKEAEVQKRNEQREKERQERQLMAQTIDMDAQQQVMVNAGDNDDDEDMGGF